ncbi:hypothetical protein ZEAMMB73_Zm00001d051656 [Zea mays]|uniref:Uncharacterized protein n=1 Tax=Zea mays TaxID=4577 RepID=A0A1D6Q8U7_MAIZE|nr:hypothetical protein ZEAMMB73_Zm00001d051656 [Zea mays]
MEGSLGFFERRETDSVQMQNVLSIRNPKPPNREACSSVSPGHENLHNSIDEAIMLKVLIKIISDMYHFHAHLWWEIEIQMLSGSTVGIFPSTYDLWDSLFGKSIIC